MAITSSSSRTAIGSGQTRHQWWPPRSMAFTNGTTTSASVSNRQGLGDVSGLSQVISGSPTATIQSFTHNAATKNTHPLLKVTLVAGTDAYGMVQGYCPCLLEQTDSAEFPGDPYYGVYRAVGIFALPKVNAAYNASSEIGLQLLPGNSTGLFSGGPHPAILFGPTDDNTIALRARKDFGALSVNDSKTWAVAGVTDPTDLNTYELRIVGATGSQPATLKAYINNRLVFGPYNFGKAAALLPGSDASGGGFNLLVPRISLAFVGTAGYFIWIHSFHEIIAPSELDSI